MKLQLVGLSLAVVPCATLAWSGDTWGNITRATIKANADLMIDSTWAPANTFTNYQYSGSYRTYYQGTTYTGVAYSQNNPQENWAEFRNAVVNTSGGSVGYGNDCSGFTSICWQLPNREVTSTFESKLGGSAKWTSLGPIGSGASVSLLIGDALNSSSVGHVVMFLNYDTTGVRTMEQTPSHAQRKIRSYSELADYRPIRRMQIIEYQGIIVSGDFAFGTVELGSSAQRVLTIYGTGGSALTVSNILCPAGLSGNWSGTIAPGGYQNIIVTFSPTAMTNYSGYLKVNSDATAGTNIIAFSGTGSSRTPVIVAQPQSPAVVVGQTVTLTVAASGMDPLSYQWRFNGASLAGATLSSYTRANAQFSHSGNYDVVVSNSYGAVTSQLALLTVMLPPVTQTLWRDNFDANTAGNWVMNRSSSDCRVAFNYDYAADGIPSAPNSTNGTTRGVKFEANVSLGRAAAINISPVGQSYGGDYRLRFDLWMNQNGPFPAGGNGSTQHGTAGVGTAGNRVQWGDAGSTGDGYWFAVDGEGQASDTSTSAMNDFGAFSGTTYHTSDSGVYAAGTASNSRGNNNSYYAGAFPSGQTAPAWQRSTYSQQTGGLAVGTIGFAWRDVIINKSGNTVEWFIDGLKIATITGASFTSSNIFVGLWDSFDSLSDNTNLSFAVFDNVRVERLVTNIPPYLTAQPQALTVTQGSRATFSVTAGGTAPLGCQWRCNGTNLAGASGSTYTVTNALPTNAASYSVVVTNSSGAVTSAVAALTVNVPPFVITQPQSPAQVTQGAGFTFCVMVSGTLPLSYQWRFNGMNIAGATTNCYSRYNVQTNDAGTYSVVVTNVAGSLTSSVVLVVVPTNAPPAEPGHFDSIGRLSDSSVQLNMSGTPGTNYVLQWTSDWVAWSNLCTLSGTNGFFWWVDSSATNARQRFYRLRLSP